MGAAVTGSFFLHPRMVRAAAMATSVRVKVSFPPGFRALLGGSTRRDLPAYASLLRYGSEGLKRKYLVPLAQGQGPATAANNPAAQPGAPDPSDKPKATPVYKKWWFWAVVAVSAYVVISIATEDSNSNSTARVMPMTANSNSPAAGAGGMTLMRW